MMYRHGDVLLIRREDAPQVDGDDAEIVVAEGEVTGHAHRVHGRAAVLSDMSDEHYEGRLRLTLPHGGAITHEEHRELVLVPGVYEVRHQRTQTQAGVWERVRD